MNGLLGGNSWQQMANALYKQVRRKIFVSYHHGGDQWYYDEFSRFFHDAWETVYDNSLERQIDSDNTAYVMQRIRDKHITGTSCTVLLIGGQTYQRKYVDWEVKATLDKVHGLLGIILPSHIKNTNNQILVPDRFVHNVNTGYASYMFWEQLTAESLTNAVNAAVSAPSRLIDNSSPMKSKNG